MERSVTDIKTVYVVWTNTDLTEGRGVEYPLACCELRTTAARMSLGNHVQGTNCPISEELAVRYNGVWCAPCRIIPPSREDQALHEQQRKEREQEARRQAAINRARELGLSEEDLKALGAHVDP